MILGRLPCYCCVQSPSLPFKGLSISPRSRRSGSKQGIAMNTVAPTLHTMAEVAERLGTSKRWLQGFLSGRPFGRMAGRSRVFTEGDIAQIIEALPCPSSSSCRAPACRKTGGYVGHNSGSALTKLRERLTKSSPRKSSQKSATTSNVKPFRGRERRPSPTPR